MKRNLWIGLGSVGLLVAGGVAYVTTRPAEAVKWRQAKVEKGNVTPVSYTHLDVYKRQSSFRPEPP